VKGRTKDVAHLIICIPKRTDVEKPSDERHVELNKNKMFEWQKNYATDPMIAKAACKFQRDVRIENKNVYRQMSWFQRSTYSA